jgi:phosphate/sulfate permease
VASWFISPILAGILGATFYVMGKRLILDSDDPRTRALLVLPAWYSLATAVVVYVIMAKSAITAVCVIHICICKRILNSPLNASISMPYQSVAIGYQLLTTFLSLIIVALATWFWIVPYVKTQLPSEVFYRIIMCCTILCIGLLCCILLCCALLCYNILHYAMLD